MKNAEKIITALKNAFPGHKLEIIYKEHLGRNCLCVDGHCIGYFEKEFFDDDYDEIELTIKAPLVSIKDFTNCIGGYEIIRAAVKRGLREWEEESRQNN